MGHWDKFCLLMWKNWRIHIRKPISLGFEIGVPLLIMGLLVLLRSELEWKQSSGYQVEPFEPNTFDMSPKWDKRAYSPNTSEKLKKIMAAYPSIEGKKNAEDLKNYLLGFNFSATYFPQLIGMQFDDTFEIKPNSTYTINLRFRLRHSEDGTKWHIDDLYPSFEISYGSMNDYIFYFVDSEYPDFLGIMFHLTNDIWFSCYGKNLTSITMKQFPSPPFDYDNFIVQMGSGLLFGILFMTAFTYAFISMVKSITLEKEKQLKESMKIMGLPTWLHWTAWFTQSIIPYTIVIVIMTILMKINMGNGAALPNTDWSIILIFLVIYVTGIITFAFALSCFFSKANRAASMAGIIFTLTMVPYLIIRCGDYTNITAFTKYASSLSIVTGMFYGFDLILTSETKYQGIQWGNMFETDLEIKISFGGNLLMMIFDIFLYLLIALYVEQIFPGDFGVPQKWYFLFTPEYWRSTQHTESNFSSRPLDRSTNDEFFEDEPTNLKPGIRIQNLTKTFGQNEVVKGISLNLYEDQITVLLGHNGAGKTTTMSMLTGMYPPSSGNAFVNGYEIRKQIMRVRDSMGYCPQHNVLFDDLTVREHLQFFSRLKGCEGEEVNIDADNFLQLLRLEDKADERSSALSGGMKRKLCVGIALCGKSKVILLDEPTAGMDPAARRFIWEFLQKEKKERTILLSTHFMDEADLLGDRIAIMSDGELKCCGSSFFLKKKYGTGYHLIIEELPNCDDKVITKLLRRYIPGLKVQSKAGTELTYLLPEDNVSMFSEMLAELETNSENLGIRSFGISLTDLEEVFMKVGTNKTGRALSNTSNNEVNVSISTDIPVFEKGIQLKINQTKAMSLKKMIATFRSWKMEIVKTVLPVLYLVLISFSASSYSKDSGSSRSFTLDDYDNPITLVEKSVEGKHKEYTAMLDKLGHKYELVEDIQKRIFELKKEDQILVKYKYVVGASFDAEGKPTAWFNADMFHSMPLSLQLMLNMYVNTDFQVNFVNNPYPYEQTSEEAAFASTAISSGYMIGLSLAVAYIGNFYILFPIRERACKAKHLQFVSGIDVFIFWTVALISDLLTMIVPFAAILTTMAILQPSGLTTFHNLSLLALLLFNYGIAVIPFTYLLSYLFTVPSNGYSREFIIGFTAGYPAIGVLMILQANEISVEGTIRWILRVLPHFDFAEGVMKVMFSVECDNNADSCASSNSITDQILMSYITAIISFTLIILIDLKIFSNLYNKLSSDENSPDYSHPMDDDVRAENKTVTTTPISTLKDENVLILKNLTKNYKNFTAVKGLNLLVKKSECFGLLGVNGAGKTTTFKMMTGDERISSGNGWINECSIRDEMKKVHRFIGYCPQFDALLIDLTARETLRMFCLIRGIPSSECDYNVAKLAKDFDFTEHLDKQTRHLSGGNKRKLSTALALIGDAPIIFLDEPTTGMDPATKRHLWNALKKIRESGKSIILTSHSMEECEALCTRLAIMVNGYFQCLGSTQHLKNKFAEGFSVTIKIKKPEHSSGLVHSDTANVEQFMTQHFPQCELREEHQELLNYYIRDPQIKWSRLFGIMEMAKRQLNIEDYSLGQASLEQVFLIFTKNQMTSEGVEQKKKKCCCF